MRALLLSDIHSNIDALEAVLAAAPPHDVVWNLGDVVGYGATPNTVIERVRGIGKFFVRGNHDRACCGLSDAENFNSIALTAVQWTAHQLDTEAMGWLRKMPCGPVKISSGEPERNRSGSPPANVSPQKNRRSAYCVHGSLLDEDQYLLSIRDAAEQPTADHGITFFGHTHIQGGFAANADGEWFALKPVYTDDSEPESYELDLRSSATYLVNPGSVGQPRDHDWRAAFALYDDAAQRVTYYRVPYDVRLAQIRIQRAGLPDALGARLRVGR